MSLDSIMIEAIQRSTVISIHAAAKMCDMKFKCVDNNCTFTHCYSCNIMKRAAEEIKERILSLLDKK